MFWVCGMPKKKFRKMAEDSLFLWKLIAEDSIPKAAKTLGITEGAVRSRLQRARELLDDANWFTMQAKNLQKNKRVRKFSTSGKLEEETDEWH
jgi:hypothetical protein